MESVDPATGAPLPADAIQRVLFVAGAVHVYQIPPLASTKGYMAASWTEDQKRHIFTARLRIIETAIASAGDETEKVKTDIVLEDPKEGSLFAAAPYTAAAVVEPALDSSRFFALRVQDPIGRKAVLGIGFEERPEAFDFSVALQEARKTLGFELEGGPKSSAAASSAKAGLAAPAQPLKDYSLKEGETITVNLSGTKFGRRSQAKEETSASSGGGGLSGFSLAPPPPPPRDSQRSPRRSGDFSRPTAEQLGFDDGQNGEFA
jgi:adaptin ear-binding coat-associated protein 1/2